MNISLTEDARNKLKIMEFEKDCYPRIDAQISGGCGVAVNYKLVFDEERRNDIVIDCGGIKFRIDQLTSRILSKDTKVDYSEKDGFIIGERFEFAVCTNELSNKE